MYEKMNKLVRDNIPEIIKQQGDIPEFVILDNDDYCEKLKAKLKEEVDEYILSDDVVELGDILEVINAMLTTKNMSMSDIEIIRNKKAQTNGGFFNRVFLKGVT